MVHELQRPPITMYRVSDGRVARYVRPGRAVERFEELGYRIIPHGEELPTEGDPHAPPSGAVPEPVVPEPFRWEACSLDELKAHYGRAMSEGALLANPHGNAGVKWYAEKLGESGWEPTTETP